MSEVKIVAIPLEDVFMRDKVRYNTNNYWANEGRSKPADYNDVLSKCHTGNWIYKFHPMYVLFQAEHGRES